jgi:hypothetical protein
LTNAGRSAALSEITLDGIVEGTGAVFESKFMLPKRRLPRSTCLSSSTTCLAQEFGFAALIDLTDELDPRTAQQRCDLLAKTGFIGLVDLGGDLQGNSLWCKFALF